MRTQIEILKSGQVKREITSSDPLVHTTLLKLEESARTQGEAIDSFLREMEFTWPKRFDWTAEKQLIESFSLSSEAVRKATEDFFETPLTY